MFNKNKFKVTVELCHQANPPMRVIWILDLKTISMVFDKACLNMQSGKRLVHIVKHEFV